LLDLIIVEVKGDMSLAYIYIWLLYCYSIRMTSRRFLQDCFAKTYSHTRTQTPASYTHKITYTQFVRDHGTHTHLQ